MADTPRWFRCERGHRLVTTRGRPEICNAALLSDGRQDVWHKAGTTPQFPCGGRVVEEIEDDD